MSQSVAPRPGSFGSCSTCSWFPRPPSRGQAALSSAPTGTRTAEGHLTSTFRVTYAYDGDGRRVKKSNGTLYWYNASGQVIEETDLSGNLIRDYIFFAGQRLARRDASGSIYYYQGDHLGRRA